MVFLDRGASIDTIDTDALHHAASGDQLQTAQLLLDSGASIDLKTAAGLTPFDIARNSNHQSVVQLLTAKTAELVQ